MLNLRFCLIVGDLGGVDSKHSIGEHHVMSCSLLVLIMIVRLGGLSPGGMQ